MKIKVGKGQIHILILIIQLLLRNGFFDLYAINDPVLGAIRLRDLSFFAALAWVVYVEFVNKGWKIRTTFTGLIRTFLCIILINCAVSYFIFGQPLLLGFQAQRDIFAGFSMFLALNTLLFRHIITKHKIYKTLFWFGVTQLFLNSLHWLLYSTMGVSLFSGATVFTSRYGGARIIFSQDDTAVFVMAVALNEIMNKRKHSVRNYGILIWVFLYYMVMEKLRAGTVAVVLALIFTVMLWRKASGTKFVFAGLMVLAAVITYNRVPLVQDVIQTLFGNNSTSANTLIIRGSARLYYVQQFLKSPIFGWGNPHADWSSAFAGQGTALGYVFSDNGIFSFMYIYGSIGLAWFVGLIIKYIRRASIMNKKNCYVFTLWGWYQAVMLITGMFWIIKNYQLTFVITLILATDYARCGVNDSEQVALKLAV